MNVLKLQVDNIISMSHNIYIYIYVFAVAVVCRYLVSLKLYIELIYSNFKIFSQIKLTVKYSKHCV